MQNSMNIDRYISMAEENFSGFDGYSPFPEGTLDLSMEGEYGANGDYGDYYYANGNMGAAPMAATVPAKQPTPYQVNVTNTTPNPLTVVLFGLNTFLLTPNFGTSVGVIVTPAQVNVSYLELLNQSASQPFETSLIRIQTSSPSQLTQILTVTSKDANGQLCQIPIITQSYFSANQFQSTILDVPYPVKIDGNTFVTFSILGNTTATYTFFPSEKINQSRILGNGSSLQQYSAPAVPVAVPMFSARPIGINRKPTMINPARR
jgi:hypothetical protein